MSAAAADFTVRPGPEKPAEGYVNAPKHYGGYSDSDDGAGGGGRFQGFTFDSEDDEHGLNAFRDANGERKRRSRRGGRKHRKARDGDDDVAMEEGAVMGAGGGDEAQRRGEHRDYGGDSDDGNASQKLSDGDPSLGLSQQKRSQGDQARNGLSAEKNQFANHYKTRMCKVYQSGEHCMYGDRCRFAHGKHQLRTYVQNQRDGLTSEEAVQKFVLAGGLSAMGRRQTDELARQSAQALAAAAVAEMGGFMVTDGMVAPNMVLPSFVVTSGAGGPEVLSAVPVATTASVSGIGGLTAQSLSPTSPLPQVVIPDGVEASAAGILSGLPPVVLPGDVVDPNKVPPFTVINGHPVGKDGRIINLDTLTKDQLSYLYKQAMKEQFKGVKKGKGGPNDPPENPRSGSGEAQSLNSPTATTTTATTTRTGKTGLDPNAANFTPGGGWVSSSANAAAVGGSLTGHNTASHDATTASTTASAPSRDGLASGPLHAVNGATAGAMPMPPFMNSPTSLLSMRSTFAASASPVPTDGEESAGAARDAKPAGADARKMSWQEASQPPPNVTGALRLKQQHVKTYFKGLIRHCFTHELKQDTIGVGGGTTEAEGKSQGGGRERANPLFASVVPPSGAGGEATEKAAASLDADDPRLMLDFYTSMAVAAQEMIKEIEEAFPGTSSSLWPSPPHQPSFPLALATGAATGTVGSTLTTPVLTVSPPLATATATAAAAGHVLSPQQQRQIFLANHQHQIAAVAAAAGMMTSPLPLPSPQGGSGFMISSPTQTPLTTPAHLLGAPTDYTHVLSPQQLQHLHTLQHQQLSPMAFLPFPAQTPPVTTTTSTAATSAATMGTTTMSSIPAAPGTQDNAEALSTGTLYTSTAIASKHTLFGDVFKEDDENDSANNEGEASAKRGDVTNGRAGHTSSNLYSRQRREEDEALPDVGISAELLDSLAKEAAEVSDTES